MFFEQVVQFGLGKPKCTVRVALGHGIQQTVHTLLNNPHVVWMGEENTHSPFVGSVPSEDESKELKIQYMSVSFKNNQSNPLKIKANINL
jgi:hypothetical protein